MNGEAVMEIADATSSSLPVAQNPAAATETNGEVKQSEMTSRDYCADMLTRLAMS